MKLRRILTALGSCIVLLGALLGSAPAAPGLPAPGVVPAGLGVNIHFTDPRPGEMEMLAAADFRFARMDFPWGRTEPQRAEYDFAAYERLLAALDRHGIRAVFILDYSNRLYDD